MLEHTTFELAKNTCQIVCATASFVINSLLIFLIITKSTKNMGNYRYLMIFFCCCSLFFSALDMFIRPIMHSYRTSFFILIDLRNREMSLRLGELLVSMMAGVFGVVIYGIAIHFIYRYFALERNERTRFFDTKYLPLWFSIPVLGGVSWTSVSFFILPMNPEFSKYMRTDIEKRFAVDPDQIAYIGVLFFVPQPDGSVAFNWKAASGFLLYMLIMIVPWTIVIYIGAKSRKKIKELPASLYGRNLQMQLFKALVAQTLIPVVMLFLPFSFIFTLPFFEIDCSALTNFQTFVYALYPAIDSLPSFLFIESYRNTVTGFLTCRRQNAVQHYAASADDTVREEQT